MELFLENHNFSYTAVHNLLNEMYSEKSGKEMGELVEKLLERNMDEEKIQQLIDSTEPYHLFKRMNGKYVPIWDDNLSLDNSIPVYPGKIEKKALFEMVEDELIGMFLSEHVKDIIRENCDFLKDEIEVKNRNPVRNNPEESKYFYVIWKAIYEGKKICYTSRTEKRIFENCIASPFRFLFSNRKNHLQLIAVPEGEDRVILINLSAFQKVEILNEKAEEGAEKLLEARKECLVLEIEDETNALERAFSLFSHMKREAYFDKEHNLHVLKVWYYDFDIKDIVRDILSLGASVFVREPESVKQQIQEEAALCKSLYCR